MNGVVVWPKGLIKTRRCGHLHVSGRRCGSVTDKKAQYCIDHAAKKNGCDECRAMMRAFTPPAGWK